MTDYDVDDLINELNGGTRAKKTQPVSQVVQPKKLDIERPPPEKKQEVAYLNTEEVSIYLVQIKTRYLDREPLIT